MWARRSYQLRGNKKKAKLLVGSPIKIVWGTDVHVDASIDNDPRYCVSKDGYFVCSAGGSTRMNQFKDMVNSEKPHLALFTGDMVQEYDIPSFDLWKNAWNGITPSIAKAFTVGNHEYYNNGQYADIVNVLGVQDRPELGGSKFNTTLSIQGASFKVKFILFDTNFDSAGNHAETSKGYVPQPTINWVQSELNKATENIIILVSHHGIHDGASFDSTSANSFGNMVKRYLALNPTKTVYAFFGHKHQQKNLVIYDNFGEFKGFLAPTMLDYNPSKFIIASIYPTGGISFQEMDANFPVN